MAGFGKRTRLERTKKTKNVQNSREEFYCVISKPKEQELCLEVLARKKRKERREEKGKEKRRKERSTGNQYVDN